MSDLYDEYMSLLKQGTTPCPVVSVPDEVLAFCKDHEILPAFASISRLMGDEIQGLERIKVRLEDDPDKDPDPDNADEHYWVVLEAVVRGDREKVRAHLDACMRRWVTTAPWPSSALFRPVYEIVVPPREEPC